VTGAVLVTRPAEDAGPLAAALRDRGHTVVLEPLLRIAPRDAALDLAGVQAVLFTSANGVRAFARLTGDRALPAFAVGPATAEACREAGFARIETAGGDVASLAALAAARLRPTDGALLHPAGSAVAGDLAGALAAAGFALRRTVVYESVQSEALSAETRALLCTGGIGAALFFSPRTAESFVNLVVRAGLGAACAHIEALCLSDAVAQRLTALAWRGVRVAPEPETAALLALLGPAGENEAP